METSRSETSPTVAMLLIRRDSNARICADLLVSGNTEDALEFARRFKVADKMLLEMERGPILTEE